MGKEEIAVQNPTVSSLEELNANDPKKALPSKPIVHVPTMDMTAPTEPEEHLHVPIIDMQALSRPELEASVGEALEEWGYFQVVNHGLDEHLVDEQLSLAQEFFDLPFEEKSAVNLNNCQVGLFNPTYYEGEGDRWRDLLKLSFHPPKFANYANWPQKPQRFSQSVKEFAVLEKGLLGNLVEIICGSLGLGKNYFAENYGDFIAATVFNNYATLSPSAPVGFKAHRDNGFISLIYGKDVGGAFQTHKDGKWYIVPQTKNAITVHVANQLQILSNGRYKSSVHDHRIPSNGTPGRISKATFLSPKPTALLKPAEELLDSKNGARYPAIHVGVCLERGSRHSDFLQKLELPIMGL